jgi:hypothetical protein
LVPYLQRVGQRNRRLDRSSNRSSFSRDRKTTHGVIVCSIATVPGREEFCCRTIETLRPQVDVLMLHVWTDTDLETRARFVETMGSIGHLVPAITSGRTSTEAKFWFAHQHQWLYGDAVHLACDDDILYPPDYAARMVEELDRHHPGVGAVGVYGATLAEGGVPSYRRAIRVVASTEAALEACQRVDLLGAGTVAYRPARWQLDDEDFVADNAGDAGLALAAARRGFNLVAVRRPARWLVDQRAPDPLWERSDRDDPGGVPAQVLRRIPRRRV